MVLHRLLSVWVRRHSHFGRKQCNPKLRSCWMEQMKLFARSECIGSASSLSGAGNRSYLAGSKWGQEALISRASAVSTFSMIITPQFMWVVQLTVRLDNDSLSIRWIEFQAAGIASLGSAYTESRIAERSPRIKLLRLSLRWLQLWKQSS